MMNDYQITCRVNSVNLQFAYYCWMRTLDQEDWQEVKNTSGGHLCFYTWEESVAWLQRTNKQEEPAHGQ